MNERFADFVKYMLIEVVRGLDVDYAQERIVLFAKYEMDIDIREAYAAEAVDQAWEKFIP